MDLRRRMEILAESAVADRDVAPRPHRPSRVGSRPLASVGIAAVRVPGGGTTSLMRVMQTNACSLSCGYCPTFCGGAVPRATITPEETARTFMDVHRKGLAQGLFLTSGVPGRPHRATDRMLATLDLLRRREGFEGYIHIKLLPGAEPAQVDEAARLATRISVNLEAPSDAYVRRLAREKDIAGDLLPKLERAARQLAARRREPGALPSAGTTTQFVVGAAGERDREILDVVAGLERRRLLHHAHFSAFQPVAGTPLEHLPATPASRELRLFGETVPFGNDLLYDYPAVPDCTAHVEICEDLWVPVPPSSRAASRARSAADTPAPTRSLVTATTRPALAPSAPLPTTATTP